MDSDNQQLNKLMTLAGRGARGNGSAQIRMKYPGPIFKLRVLQARALLMSIMSPQVLKLLKPELAVGSLFALVVSIPTQGKSDNLLTVECKSNFGRLVQRH